MDDRDNVEIDHDIASNRSVPFCSLWREARAYLGENGSESALEAVFHRAQSRPAGKYYWLAPAA